MPTKNAFYLGHVSGWWMDHTENTETSVDLTGACTCAPRQAISSLFVGQETNSLNDDRDDLLQVAVVKKVRLFRQFIQLLQKEPFCVFPAFCMFGANCHYHGVVAAVNFLLGWRK